MKTRHANRAITTAEVLKLLRADEMTREQVAASIQISVRAASAWLNEFEANGILVARERRTGKPGSPNRVFRLAPEWGGKACL